MPFEIYKGKRVDGCIPDEEYYLAVAYGTNPGYGLFRFVNNELRIVGEQLSAVGSAAVRDISFSPDGNYLWAASSSVPLAFLFAKTGDQYVAQGGSAVDVQPPSTPFSCEVSANGRYFAIGHNNTPYFSVYDSNSGVPFIRLASPASPPTVLVRSPSFSPDNNYIACPYLSSPFVTVYNVPALTVAGVFDSIPSGTGCYCSAYSPSGSLFVVGHSGTPFLSIYAVSGVNYTKLADLAVGNRPAGQVNSVSFSPDGNYLATAHTGSPFLTIYSVSGTTLTKLSDPSILPGATGTMVRFSPDNKYLACCNTAAGTRRLMIYERVVNSFNYVPLLLPGSTTTVIESVSWFKP